ncbi:MAG: hypothetical protein JXR91_00135, partial [Deltaproteobacteria bacterium]|nr:hypothetical protein [Deltaproteobacteria bacterium]
AELIKFNEILNRWQKNVIQQNRNRLVELNSKLVMWSKTALNTPRNNLASASMGIYSWPEPATEKLKGRFGQAVTGLNALSPLASLGRGYSILKDKNGVIVKDAAALKKGDLVNVKLHKGQIAAEVKNIESE